MNQNSYGDNRFSFDLGNFQMPAQLQPRFSRSMSSVTQGLLPNFSASQLSQQLPTESGQYNISTPSPSVFLNVPLEPQYIPALNHNQPHLAANVNQNDEGHNHGHGHTHAQPAAETSPDLRRFMEWLQKSGIFFILLFIKLMYEHRLGILVFVALAGTFYYVNLTFVNYVHQTAVRENQVWCSVGTPLWLVIFLGANILALYYMFSEQALWLGLIFKMPYVDNVDIWALLWVVLLNDYIVKFATIIAKALVAMLPFKCLPHRRRGKYFMLMETLSQYYRVLIPTRPWFAFLYNHQQTGYVFSWTTIVIYFIFKINVLWASIKSLAKAFRRLQVHSVYGTKPSIDDLKQKGEHCPICQDDCKEPVMLNCRHIFCENCVSVWFDRERTCPMCRAQITESPHWQDGTTAAQPQWY